MAHKDTRLTERFARRGKAELGPLLAICALGLLVLVSALVLLRTPGGAVEETRVSRHEKPPEQEEPPPAEPPAPPQPDLTQRTLATNEEPSEPENARRELTRPSPRRLTNPASPNATNVLTGRVLDPITTTPVSLFTVHCFPAALGDPVALIEQGQRSPLIVRDAQGKFRVQSLEPGAYSLVIDAPGYKREVVLGVRVPSEREIDVPVRRGAYIDGKLLDASGRPVTNYEVNLDAKPYDPKKFPRIRTRKTDNTGYYRFTDLPPGEYRVSMGSLANADPDLVSRQIVLANDEQHETQDFVMPLRNTLTFTITDDRGVALNAVRIRCYDRNNHFNAVTDQNGETKVEHVRDGEYSLNIVCRGFKQVQEKLTVSGGAATIPVRRVLVKEKS